MILEDNELRENIIALGYASPSMDMRSEKFDKDFPYKILSKFFRF